MFTVVRWSLNLMLLMKAKNKLFDVLNFDILFPPPFFWFQGKLQRCTCMCIQFVHYNCLYSLCACDPTCKNDYTFFFVGNVHVGLKDSTFEPSSPIRHSCELYHVLAFSSLSKPILFLYSDGGPDHRLTYITVRDWWIFVNSPANWYHLDESLEKV